MDEINRLTRQNVALAYIQDPFNFPVVSYTDSPSSGFQNMTDHANLVKQDCKIGSGQQKTYSGRMTQSPPSLVSNRSFQYPDERSCNRHVVDHRPNCESSANMFARHQCLQHASEPQEQMTVRGPKTASIESTMVKCHGRKQQHMRFADPKRLDLLVREASVIEPDRSEEDLLVAAGCLHENVTGRYHKAKHKHISSWKGEICELTQVLGRERPSYHQFNHESSSTESKTSTDPDKTFQAPDSVRVEHSTIMTSLAASMHDKAPTVTDAAAVVADAADRSMHQLPDLTFRGKSFSEEISELCCWDSHQQGCIESFSPMLKEGPYYTKESRILGHCHVHRDTGNAYTPEICDDLEEINACTSKAKLRKTSRKEADLMPFYDSSEETVKDYLMSATLNRRIQWTGQKLIMSYSEVGALDGMPIFLLPGLGFTRFIATFLDHTANLYKLRIITIDRPGQGASDKLKGGLFGKKKTVDLVLAIEQIARELRMSRFGLIAHSTSAIYALKISAALPERLHGPIMLISPFLPKSSLFAGTNQDAETVRSRSSPVNRRLKVNSPGSSQSWMSGPCPPAVFEQRRRRFGLTRLSNTADCLPTQPTTLCRRGSKDRKVLNEHLWHASTSPVQPEYDLANLPRMESNLFASTSGIRIVHARDDEKVPLSYARRLNELLPDSSLTTVRIGGHELLCDTAIMSSILEYMAVRIQS